MQKFVLNDSLKTGVKMIDTHHQQLIDAINDLGDLIEERQQGNAVKKILTFLQFYAEWHFNHEEQCVHKHQCSLAEDKSEAYNHFCSLTEDNLKAHAKFLDMVKQYKEKYRQEGADQASIAKEIYEELSKWLIAHIKGIDVVMGQQILAETASS